jgi:glycosyltransferase involved in cell wall biosynthesis
MTFANSQQTFKNKVKEVTVFTNGDSRNLSTWSNVPYFFTETLLLKGIQVNRVDISPSPFLAKIYAKTFQKLLKAINNRTYDYLRSFMHFIDVKLKIWKALKKCKDSDVSIFLTFSFSSAGLTKKPTILFCDWTYDHYFKYFLNREPDLLERACIAREDRQIENADLVFPLFPGVADYMKSRYGNRNIFYLGNVVNSLLDVDEFEILEKKLSANNILLIGSTKYLEGAESLIQAYISLKERFPKLSLSIVGMNREDFVALPDGVTCYGYLDKAKKEERELYYSLLIGAKVFVNTTPKWGAFSATLEAMYFYNPIIVTPYDEFVQTFGLDINFGYYCNDDSIASLCSNIINILENAFYKSLTINAHEAVKDYTWSAYIDKLLAKVNAIL